MWLHRDRDGCRRAHDMLRTLWRAFDRTLSRKQHLGSEERFKLVGLCTFSSPPNETRVAQIGHAKRSDLCNPTPDAPECLHAWWAKVEYKQETHDEDEQNLLHALHDDI